MAPKVDSLATVANARQLSFNTKPVENDSIEVFPCDTRKANVDEINISTTNQDIAHKEKSDTKKKWFITAAIALGTVAVGVASYFLLKKINAKTLTKRWSGKPEQYIPDCSIPNSEIPMHHFVEGSPNSGMRSVKQILKQSKYYEDDIYALAQTTRIDHQFAKLAPLEKDCIAYRKVTRGVKEFKDQSYRIIDNAKIDDIVVPDQGCGYASHHISFPEQWRGGRQEGMLYTIRIPKGARVSRNMEHGGEILMPRAAEYKLISKQQTSEGIMEVTLEYVIPKSVIQKDIPQIKKIAEKFVGSTDEFSRRQASIALEEIGKLEQIQV